MFKLHCPDFMKSENTGTDWISIASWYHEWSKINVAKKKKVVFLVIRGITKSGEDWSCYRRNKWSALLGSHCLLLVSVTYS